MLYYICYIETAEETTNLYESTKSKGYYEYIIMHIYSLTL